MLHALTAWPTDFSPQVLAFPGKVLHTPFSGACWPVMDGHKLLRRINHTLWRIGGRSFYNRQIELGWPERLADWARKNWSIEPPDILWGVASNTIAGAIGAQRLAAFFSRPYVLDLHDPPLSRWRKGLDPALEPFFASSLREASHVVTTTESYARHLVGTYKLDPSRVSPVYMSFDDKECSFDRPKESGLVLLHAGTIESTGRIEAASSLIAALSILTREIPDCASSIRFCLLGTQAGKCQVQRLAARLGVSQNVICRPPVSYQDSLRIMSDAHVLVLLKNPSPTFDMQIPGKLFKYLGLRKPILGIVNGNTEAAEILRKSGLGLVAPATDIQMICGHLRQLWAWRDRLGDVFRPNEPFISTFSKTYTARQFESIIQTAIERFAGKSTA